MNSGGQDEERVNRKRKFDSPAQEVYLSLWRTYDRLRALEDALFSELDLTPQQYNVLRILQATSPRPLPTLKISERLISRAPDITRMIDKLQQRGFVDRVRSEEDRRTVFVTITDAGKQLLDELQGRSRGCIATKLGICQQATVPSCVGCSRSFASPTKARRVTGKFDSRIEVNSF